MVKDFYLGFPALLRVPGACTCIHRSQDIPCKRVRTSLRIYIEPPCVQAFVQPQSLVLLQHAYFLRSYTKTSTGNHGGKLAWVGMSKSHSRVYKLRVSM